LVKAAKKLQALPFAIGMALLFAFIVFPFLWLLISSFKYPNELYVAPPIWIPKHPTLEGYFELLRTSDFLSSILASALVAVTTTLVSLPLGSLGAYAIARLRFPGTRVLFLSVLGTQMIPPIVILIPLYVLFRGWNLIGTYSGIILSHLTFTLPYVIWLLYSYMVRIPRELEEAAWIDGCSRFRGVLKVVLPVSLPGLISTGIFAFIGSWNDLIYTLIISGGGVKTVPVKLAEFIGQERIVYELMFPGAIIGSIPVILIAFFFQRYIIQGITEGAVKL